MRFWSVGQPEAKEGALRGTRVFLEPKINQICQDLQPVFSALAATQNILIEQILMGPATEFSKPRSELIRGQPVSNIAQWLVSPVCMIETGERLPNVRINGNRFHVVQSKKANAIG